MLNFEQRKDYEDKRYERLKEMLSEYLDDEGQSSAKFLDDLERALLENSQYFKGRADAYSHIQDFFK